MFKKYFKNKKIYTPKAKKGIKNGLEKNINKIEVKNNFLFKFETIEKYNKVIPKIEITSFEIPLVQKENPAKIKKLQNKEKKFYLY